MYSSAVAYVIIRNVTSIGGTIHYFKCKHEMMSESDNIAFIGISQSVGIVLQLRENLGLENTLMNIESNHKNS
jgi:hypothetical protein